MTDDLIYGKMAVHNILNRDKEADFTIAVIRHSERPSFNKIPTEKWADVTITDRGIEAAKKFGKALGNQAVPPNSLKVYYTGQRRCADTAAAIATGIGQSAGPEERGLNFISPIADAAKYDDMLKNGRWKELLDGWLSSDNSYDCMTPVSLYTREFFRKLTSLGYSHGSNVVVIVAHDLQIFPLVSKIFGKNITNIDYLEGPVISKKKDDFEIGFGNEKRSVSTLDIIR